MTIPIESIRYLIIDIDGVLWRGATVLPGVASFFDFLRRETIRFVLVTNNATRTSESQAKRFADIGVSIAPEQILTSAKATLYFLQHELPGASLLLVVGEEALLDTLNHGGFEAIPADSADGRKPAAVIVALDRGVNFRKLAGAFAAIRSGAQFIATNTDTTFPVEGGMVPGAGAIVAAVQTASSVDPVVVGKPHPPMFKAAMEILAGPPGETAMLGDRLDTDIQGARSVGLTTILVYTGVSTPAEVDASPIKPDHAFRDIVELTDRWQAALALARS